MKQRISNKLALLIASALIIIIGVHVATYFLPRIVHESQVVTFNNNNGHTSHFSPDGKYFSYLHRVILYKCQRIFKSKSLTLEDFLCLYWFTSRQETLEYSLYLRWFPIDHQENELSILLDSIDFSLEGESNHRIFGKVYFSPDSKHLAAICATCIIIVNIETKETNKLNYGNENFGSLSWYSKHEIVFNTILNDKDMLWKYNINKDQKNRVNIHKENIDEECYSDGYNSPMFSYHKYSLNGQYVFSSSWQNNNNSDKLININNGLVHPLPATGRKIVWNADGSQALITETSTGFNYGLGHPSRKRKIYLVDTKPFHITDVTDNIKYTRNYSYGFSYSEFFQFTADNKYGIYHNFMGNKRFGYLVQLHPFKIILKKEGYIHKSPLPGWVILEKENSFSWLDYSGQKMIRLEGYPSEWIWSPDKIHAAKIEDAKVVVFKPIMPE